MVGTCVVAWLFSSDSLSSLLLLPLLSLLLPVLLCAVGGLFCCAIE